MSKNDIFSLETRQDGVYISTGEGQKFSLDDASDFLQQNGITQYDDNALESFVRSDSGKSVRITDKTERSNETAEIKIDIAKDALSAKIYITPSSGEVPWPSVNSLIKRLKVKNVTTGIKEDILRDVVENRRGNEWFCVAEGRTPQNGKDAEILYKVEFGACKPREHSDADRVDLKELATITTVLKGRELAEKIPAIAGVNGMSVLGRILKAKDGRDKRLPAGKGTAESEDGLHLNAAIDGHITFNNNKINVLPVYTVSGDVDYSVGNIDFVGDVVVKGAVREGFEINTSGNIEVSGVVEGASLKCGGTISIRGGVPGAGKATFRADGSIVAAYVDQSTFNCEKDIKVKAAIRHSSVMAGNRIEVQGKSRGLIVGGRVQAGLEIVCRTLGNDMGTRTEVAVGAPPKMIERRKSLSVDIKEKKAQFDKVEKNLAFLKKLESEGNLDEQKRKLSIQLARAKFQLKSSIQEDSNEVAILENKIDKSRMDGRIRVREICYPGVMISIRGMTYVVREELKFVSFAYEDGEIRIKPFDY